ncbi:hypothetical protein V8F20_000081 [Naviculisporaceae sp. PSN 640]
MLDVMASVSTRVRSSLSTTVHLWRCYTPLYTGFLPVVHSSSGSSWHGAARVHGFINDTFSSTDKWVKRLFAHTKPPQGMVIYYPLSLTPWRTPPTSRNPYSDTMCHESRLVIECVQSPQFMMTSGCRTSRDADTLGLLEYGGEQPTRDRWRRSNGWELGSSSGARPRDRISVFIDTPRKGLMRCCSSAEHFLGDELPGSNILRVSGRTDLGRREPIETCCTECLKGKLLLGSGRSPVVIDRSAPPPREDVDQRQIVRAFGIVPDSTNQALCDNAPEPSQASHMLYQTKQLPLKRHNVMPWLPVVSWNSWAFEVINAAEPPLALGDPIEHQSDLMTPDAGEEAPLSLALSNFAVKDSRYWIWCPKKGHRHDRARTGPATVIMNPCQLGVLDKLERASRISESGSRQSRD